VSGDTSLRLILRIANGARAAPCWAADGPPPPLPSDDILFTPPLMVRRPSAHPLCPHRSRAGRNGSAMRRRWRLTERPAHPYTLRP